MKIKKNKEVQEERLKELCKEKAVDFKSLEHLLESVKSKKIRKISYHHQKISDTIKSLVK